MAAMNTVMNCCCTCRGYLQLSGYILKFERKHLGLDEELVTENSVTARHGGRNHDASFTQRPEAEMACDDIVKRSALV